MQFLNTYYKTSNNWGLQRHMQIRYGKDCYKQMMSATMAKQFPSKILKRADKHMNSGAHRITNTVENNSN